MAGAVIAAHAWPLGFGRMPPLHEATGGQVDLGLLAVFGFFGLSGFLITASALRLSFTRFLWHRALRIYPAFWVALALTALVVAPLVWWTRGQPVLSLFQGPDGPLQYVARNLGLPIRQAGIGDIFLDTPGGAMTGTSLMNGSLWSLQYEAICYLLASFLCITLLRRRSRRLIIAGATALWLLLVADLAAFGRHVGPGTWEVHFGVVGVHILIYLLYAFALGAVAHVLQDDLILSARGAAVSALLVLSTLWWGAFFVLGLPALLYLLLWAASSLPARLHRWGQLNDYSYGLYVYGWPVQMCLSVAGAAQFGLPAFVILSLAGALMLAVPSWHLLEAPMLRKKHWRSSCTPAQPMEASACLALAAEARDRRVVLRG